MSSNPFPPHTPIIPVLFIGLWSTPRTLAFFQFFVEVLCRLPFLYFFPPHILNSWPMVFIFFFALAEEWSIRGRPPLLSTALRYLFSAFPFFFAPASVYLSPFF